MKDFEFEGSRQQAEDTFFEKEFENGLHINLPSGEIEELNFEIPQGTYDPIKFSFDTYKQEEDDDDKSSLYLSGSYYNKSVGQSYPVVVDLKSKESFEVRVKTSSGESEVNLVHGEPRTATITLNPVSWFQNINEELLDDARLVKIGGYTTLYISKDFNEDIFHLVVDELDSSVEAKFD